MTISEICGKIFRSGVVYKKSGLKNFAKFTGKHLCQRLFLIKLQGSDLQLYLKKALAQVFSCEFCEIFKNIFYTEHLRPAASELSNYRKKY